MSNPHTKFALTNFSLSGASGLYDSARPSYPTAALAHIVSSLPLSNDTKVVELGAGTGLFTRMLLESAKGKIQSLVCVEPAEGMRIGFEKGLKGMSKEARGETECTIVDGGFDSIDVEDSSVDLVIAAQAFHWIGKDGESAIDEIARVLKPNGIFALIWNLEDRRTEWVGQLRDAYEVYEENTPQYRHGYWKHIFNLPSYTANFTPATETDYIRSLEATPDLVYNRVLSKSFVTAQTKEVQDEIVEKLKSIVEEGKGKVWIDEKAGTFEYPYVTDLYMMTRK